MVPEGTCCWWRLPAPGPQRLPPGSAPSLPRLLRSMTGSPSPQGAAQRPPAERPSSLPREPLRPPDPAQGGEHVPASSAGTGLRERTENAVTARKALPGVRGRTLPTPSPRTVPVEGFRGVRTPDPARPEALTGRPTGSADWPVLLCSCHHRTRSRAPPGNSLNH